MTTFIIYCLKRFFIDTIINCFQLNALAYVNSMMWCLSKRLITIAPAFLMPLVFAAILSIKARLLPVSSKKERRSCYLIPDSFTLHLLNGGFNNCNHILTKCVRTVGKYKNSGLGWFRYKVNFVLGWRHAEKINTDNRHGAPYLKCRGKMSWNSPY